MYININVSNILHFLLFVIGKGGWCTHHAFKYSTMLSCELRFARFKHSFNTSILAK